jgi:hypothetical protein
LSFYLLTGIGLWYAGKPIQITFSAVVASLWKYVVAALAAGTATHHLLRSFDPVAGPFGNLHITVRILISGTISLSLYLLMTMALYRGTRPITQLLSLAGDIAPSWLIRRQPKEQVAEEAKRMQIEL